MRQVEPHPPSQAMLQPEFDPTDYKSSGDFAAAAKGLSMVLGPFFLSHLGGPNVPTD